jgi:tetratricopeptide (TPR) repeat protein
MRQGQARVLWQGVLLLVLVVLAWRITALGVVSLQLAKLEDGGAVAARQALDWYPGQAAALYRLGIESLRRGDGDSERLLTDAYRHNPTDYRPLLALAAIARSRGDLERADALSERLDALRPANASVQRYLGQYWLDRGRPELAFKHWSRALEADPHGSAPLFETLRGLLREPGMGPAFQSLARNPPPWWDDFFTDTAQHAADVDLVRRLNRLRGEVAEAPLTHAERQAYFERLMREGLLEEAYLAWVSGLNAAQRKYLGPLYNGSFELPLSGFGFDWQVSKVPRVEIERAHPEGEDRLALRLRFRLLRVPFEHLAQPLFLGKGSYELVGSYRSQDLLTEAGFRWVVRCQDPAKTLLGQSERLFPVESWTGFRVEIEVPANCPSQDLRLVSADAAVQGKNPIDGELWFDEMSIRRIDRLSPLGRANLDGLRMEEQGTKNKAGQR